MTQIVIDKFTALDNAFFMLWSATVGVIEYIWVALQWIFFWSSFNAILQRASSSFYYCQVESISSISGKCHSSVKHSKDFDFGVFFVCFLCIVYPLETSDHKKIPVCWRQARSSTIVWLSNLAFDINAPAISCLAFSGYASTVCSGQQSRCTNTSETGGKNRLEQACYTGNSVKLLGSQSGTRPLEITNYVQSQFSEVILTWKKILIRLNFRQHR